MIGKEEEHKMIVRIWYLIYFVKKLDSTIYKDTLPEGIFGKLVRRNDGPEEVDLGAQRSILGKDSYSVNKC